MSRMHIDRFSGAIAELKPGQRTIPHALRAIATDPRVSTFERGAGWLESLIRDMVTQGLMTEDDREPSPWHRFNLTDKGRAMLAG